MKIPRSFIIIPIILAIFSFLFYSAYKEVKDKTLKEFNLQQFAMAKQASRGIESFFIYYRRELQFLSKLNYVSDLNDQGENLLAEFYKNHTDQIEAITVVDKNGILKYTFPPIDSVVGNDISNQEHIRTVIKTHIPTVSDVFTSVQGFRTIAYHIPIMSGNEFKGSIAVLIPIDRLGKRYIENIKTLKTGYGFMLSEKGIELFNPHGQAGKSFKEQYAGSPSVLNLVDKALNLTEGTSTCYLAPNDGYKKGLSKTLSSFYRISLPNTYWTILILTPEKEVYATLTAFRNHLLILFLLVIILMTTYYLHSLKASSILKEEKKRKALENILRESEKRFRIMFELSPVGIILIDEKGTIIEVNSSFCETLGYTKRELISGNVKIFASPLNDGDIEKNIDKILSGETMKHEVTNIKKDRTTCTISLYETMINLPDGKPGILSVAYDITQRKKVHQELILSKEKAEESDKLKSAFLTNISHEIRTPLNAIIGFSSLISDADTDKEINTYSKIILQSGNHLLNLVEDILDISMIETGQMKMVYEKAGIISILNEVKDIINGDKIREKKNDIGIVLKTDHEKNEIFILTDKRKLKQILINLLKNSLKFTNEGYIEFGFNKVYKAGTTYLEFYVKDTGIGIDKKYHDVVFDVFRQINKVQAPKNDGTGLGLSIAKRIVEMMGGEIWVESEQGRGSTFYFTIPSESEVVPTEGNPSI
ncbi:MAG: PAS domain S-box protein [Bacteroidales bacterium]|nr:PAS domain S-box protein [Bacteroidales bacterium]